MPHYHDTHGRLQYTDATPPKATKQKRSAEWMRAKIHTAKSDLDTTGMSSSTLEAVCLALGIEDSDEQSDIDPMGDPMGAPPGAPPGSHGPTAFDGADVPRGERTQDIALAERARADAEAWRKPVGTTLSNCGLVDLARGEAARIHADAAELRTAEQAMAERAERDRTAWMRPTGGGR